MTVIEIGRIHNGGLYVEIPHHVTSTISTLSMFSFHLLDCKAYKSTLRDFECDQNTDEYYFILYVLGARLAILLVIALASSNPLLYLHLVCS